MDSHAEDMRRLLIRMVRELVKYPDAVSARMIESPKTVRMSLRVDPSDVERITGTKGVGLESLRKILDGLGAREGRKYILDIESAGNAP